ncbi:MAG TPA: 4-oxalocrotonate tautomerase [Paenalcaligenes sp.]|nr:4-oxalocrotonate tautomerase [Paenalcaligenes sp.]
MPSITVKLFEGRDVDTKRELAQALTAESCRVLGCSPEAVDIIFVDVKREDWATAGVLWSEQK